MLSVQEIGERIAVARKMKNLSQAQLAELLAISAQAVGKWERGESMPDIVTFQRLAEALGVDLNYFGGGQEMPATTPNEPRSAETGEKTYGKPGWDMSRSNWVDADFSGLRGLAEKFSMANIERCLFVESDLSGLKLKGNNISHSDFTRSVLRRCSFSATNLENNGFFGCDFSEGEITRSNVNNCDFSRANLTDLVLRWSNLSRIKLSGAVLKGTVFRFGKLADIVFNGMVADCSFENCDFSRVEFQEATIRDTFFKNCKLRRAKFVACKADKLSYAFMKSCKADLSDVEMIEETCGTIGFGTQPASV